jgi:hypothetical protein
MKPEQAMTTPKPTSQPPWNSLETLIQTYAEMALAGGDQALKDGRRDYLLQRFLELNQDFPGLRSMIIERIKSLK